MAGRVVDLTSSGISISEPVIVDSNVVIAWQVAAFQGDQSLSALQAATFIQTLRTGDQQAVLTPTAYSEVVHATIKAIFQRSRADYRLALTVRYGRRGGFSWRDLYKLDPTILQQQASALEEFRQRLLAANLALLDQSDLGPVPSGQRYDRELLDRIVRYGLDTSDATILMEAMRIGIQSIVSLDRDMQCAVADFDVYTWLS